MDMKRAKEGSFQENGYLEATYLKSQKIKFPGHGLEKMTLKRRMECRWRRGKQQLKYFRGLCEQIAER